MSEILVSKSREAAREYYQKLKPEKYLEMIRYESIDYDPIPDFIERIDMNPRTDEFRFNYPYEVFIVGKEKRPYHPYL